MSTPRIPRSRLRRAGPPGADTGTWIARACLLALVLAAGWFALAAFKPLEDAETDAVAGPPSITPLQGTGADADARGERIAALSSKNLFAADQRPWPVLPMGRTAAASDDTAPDEEPDAPAETVVATTQVVGDRVVLLTPKESVPDDVKAALNSLRLRGVHRGPSGRESALIGMSGPSNTYKAETYMVGDEFEDPKFPQEAWRVEAIDVGFARVILARGDSVVPLALYPEFAYAQRPSSSGVPRVISASDSAVEDALRNAGLDAQTIAQVMAGVRDPESALAAERLLQIAEASAEPATDEPAADEAPARRAPPRMPGGLEQMFKQMAEQTTSATSRRQRNQSEDKDQR